MDTHYKPNNYSTVSPYLIVAGASETIDFLKRVFDAVELRRFLDSAGKIRHAEVRIEDTVVMIADSSENWPSVPVDAQAYRKRVEGVLSNEINEWAGVWEMAEELMRIIEMGETFIQRRDYESASAIYDAVASGVVKYYVRYSDDLSEDLDEVVTACVYGLKRCLQAGLEKGITRERVLRALFALYRLDAEAGGTGVSGDAEALLRDYTTADERRMTAGWVREVIAENRRKRVFVSYSSRSLDDFSADEEVDGTVLIDLVGVKGLLRWLEGDMRKDASE